MRPGRSAVPRWWCGLGAGAGFAPTPLGTDPLWTLLGAGERAIARKVLARPSTGLPAVGALIGEAVLPSPALGTVGLFSLKVGTLLFGSGMMLFAFIAREVVGGGLTARHLADAVALGAPWDVGTALLVATSVGLLFLAR